MRMKSLSMSVTNPLRTLFRTCWPSGLLLEDSDFKEWLGHLTDVMGCLATVVTYGEYKNRKKSSVKSWHDPCTDGQMEISEVEHQEVIES